MRTTPALRGTQIAEFATMCNVVVPAILYERK